MEITCWQPRHRGLPPGRQLPAGLRVTSDRPGLLYYPHWAVLATVSFRTLLTGKVSRAIPVLVDALTDRTAILPAPPPVEAREVPDDAVLEPQVELTDERIAALRESLLPVILRRFRLAATPSIETRVVGLAYKELLVYPATLGAGDYRLYVDTLTAEWTLRPSPHGGAVPADAPPQLAGG